MTLAVNELLLPIGFAIVLFAAGTLGQRLAAANEARTNGSIG